MSGGALSKATVFALSIQPYINSSIIIQLLTIAIPALERLQKEGGEEGRKKIASITRYTTVGIALVQGFGYYMLMRNGYGGSGTMLTDPGIWAAIVILATFTAGSAFLMWLGEQITEFGIGNGISIILFASIVSRLPAAVSKMILGITHYYTPVDKTDWTESQIANYFSFSPLGVAGMVLGMLVLVVFIVFISNSERRLPVQYAKRVVGRKMYGGQSSHLPMKLNMSGVMPSSLPSRSPRCPQRLRLSCRLPVRTASGMGASTLLIRTLCCI
jgi:preprotein translocase subunit SecY